jgi:hypothetical protein
MHHSLHLIVPLPLIRRNDSSSLAAPKLTSSNSMTYSHAAMALVGSLVITLLTSVASATTCYDYSGAESTTIPCNSSASISTCCHPQDICLSNGLCLGVSINNLLSVQGCTSKTWASPCQNYCKGKVKSYIPLLAFYIQLILSRKL